MALKMRLTRLGDKKSPFYRIVVADSRKSRDGEYVDQVGTFNPANDEVKLDCVKANDWINKGAQPTDTVKALLKKNGAEVTPKKSSKKAEKKPAKKATTAKKTTKKATTEETK